MIVGRDVLQKAGITLDFQHGAMWWLGQNVAMKAMVDGLQLLTINKYLQSVDDAAEEEENFAVEIKDAKYEAVS
eukprot:15359430-Ditylum_brightwellii.AAC.1